MNINIGNSNIRNNNYNANKTVYQINKPWQALIITSIAIIAGIIILIWGINNNIKTENYIEIEAVVVNYEENFDNKYHEIVEYTVDGQTYSSTSSTASNIPDSIGSTVIIKYNPDDPSEVSWDTGLSRILMPACGILFIVVGIIGSIRFIKKGLDEGFNSGSNQKYTYNGLYSQEQEYENNDNNF